MRKKRLSYLIASALLISGLSSVSREAKAADAMDFLKGCIILGGIGVGGAALAVSQSSATIKNAQGLVVAGVTSCLIGGFISADIARKAEITAAGKMTVDNLELSNKVRSVQHDLCLLKHTCGPDGILYCVKQKTCHPDGTPLDSDEMPPMQAAGKDGINAYMPSASGTQSGGYVTPSTGN